MVVDMMAASLAMMVVLIGGSALAAGAVEGRAKLAGFSGSVVAHSNRTALVGVLLLLLGRITQETCTHAHREH